MEQQPIKAYIREVDGRVVRAGELRAAEVAAEREPALQRECMLEPGVHDDRATLAHDRAHLLAVAVLHLLALHVRRHRVRHGGQYVCKEVGAVEDDVLLLERKQALGGVDRQLVIHGVCGFQREYQRARGDHGSGHEQSN